MIPYGFLQRKTPPPAVEEVLRFRRVGHEVPDLVTIGSHEKVGAAIDAMQRYGISQLPVVRGDEKVDSLADVVGSLQERELLDRVFKNPDALNDEVAVAMQSPLPAVDGDASVDQVYEGLSSGSGARSEEHTSELQSQSNLVCRLLLEKKKKDRKSRH